MASERTLYQVQMDALTDISAGIAAFQIPSEKMKAVKDMKAETGPVLSLVKRIESVKAAIAPGIHDIEKTAAEKKRISPEYEKVIKSMESLISELQQDTQNMSQDNPIRQHIENASREMKRLVDVQHRLSMTALTQQLQGMMGQKVSRNVTAAEQRIIDGVRLNLVGLIGRYKDAMQEYAKKGEGFFHGLASAVHLKKDRGNRQQAADETVGILQKHLDILNAGDAGLAGIIKIMKDVEEKLKSFARTVILDKTKKEVSEEDLLTTAKIEGKQTTAVVFVNTLIGKGAELEILKQGIAQLETIQVRIEAGAPVIRPPQA